ncbi:MAG: ArsA-related P-loop ATPase [Gemmatimonadales bacterium]|nr:ArsA-related P-loop ATPase [Gemmatimonadales bacterium]
MRIILYTGKGGVGKTSVAAATAVRAAEMGYRTIVMSTDPAMWLMLENLDERRERELLRPFLLPYPVGLYVAGLGPLTSSDVYADSTVWAMFERDLYHSPRVVWGRDVNLLLAALARRGNAAAVDSIRTAVERSGFQHAELWSYRIEGGLRPQRYGTGSDVQLWSLTDLAVQFLVARLAPSER